MNNNSRIIEQAAIDNIRNHKIGIEDGFTPEQASDLGFETFDQVVDLLQKPEQDNAQETAAENIGRIACADCGQVIPCSHAGIGLDGKGYTKGY